MEHQQADRPLFAAQAREQAAPLLAIAGQAREARAAFTFARVPATVRFAVPSPVTVAPPGVTVSEPADAVRVTVSVVESASLTEKVLPNPVKASVAPWATWSIAAPVGEWYLILCDSRRDWRLPCCSSA